MKAGYRNHNNSNNSSNDNNDDDNNDIEKCVRVLRDNGIKVCVFDMDQTAVAAHSRGRLRRGGLAQETYINRATRAFVELVPALHRNGFGLAIATHSDEHEYSENVRPETHILGSALARAVLEHHFEPDVSSAFYVVAYNPRARGTMDDEKHKIKRHHMRLILDRFGVDPHEIVFWDDVPRNVQDCRVHFGVHAILVNATKGFQLHNVLGYHGW